MPLVEAPVRRVVRSRAKSAHEIIHVSVPPFDVASAEGVRAHQQRLTRPRGTLGALEEIPVQLAGLQRTTAPKSRPAAALVFASDHPVARHGVPACPVESTAAMVRNLAAGGAAASVLARQLRIPLHLVDVGVQGPAHLAFPEGMRLVRAPVARDPAGDLRIEDAMSEATFGRAVLAGAAAVDALPAGVVILLLGEMGMGNTTAASAVAATLLGAAGADADALVGSEIGVTGDALERRRAVVRDALARVGRVQSPEEAVRRLGGRDIAALLGAAARACERGMAILVDGFVVSTAVLALARTVPATRTSFLFAHRSGEPGHRRVLEALDARPLLDLELRLGEASGALLALPLIDHACALHAGMATFESAGIPRP
jgi:nicotinate-nucleotide--dimethylbenzimidazole phosphoribosyltransferase